VTAQARNEDRHRFPAGRAQYVADSVTPETLHLAFVRSPVATGRIEHVDIGETRAAAGVVDAVTAADCARLPGVTLRYGPGKTYTWSLLPQDEVSYVGEPLAAVVATDRRSAEQAAGLCVVDIAVDAPTPLLDARAALESERRVRAGTDGNLAFETTRGVADVDAELAAADVVVHGRYRTGRKSAFPLEPRGAVAWIEPVNDQLVVLLSTQSPHVARKAIATFLGRSVGSVRVIVPDVGGGFGLKAQVSAEELCVAWLAARLQRRVAWIEDRWENLVGSNHAHDELIELRAGFTGDGHLLAVDAQVYVDIGAHSCYPFSSSLIPSTAAGHLFGCYKVGRMSVRAVAAFTNKPPSGAYRGVGAPSAVFAAERALDEAAWRLGISRHEIRRRNLVGVTDLPYAHGLGETYHEGDPRGLYDEAVAQFRAALPELDLDLPELDLDRPALDEELPSLDGNQHVIGIGIAAFNEHSAPGSSVYRTRGVTEVPGFDTTRIELAEDGTVIAYLSSADAGQDHVTTARMEIARLLRVHASSVRVVEGDTQVCPPGTGTFASRFAAAHLVSAATAATRLEAKIQSLAATFLGCEVTDLQPAEGGGYTSPTSSQLLGLSEIAARAALGEGMGEETLPLEASGHWDGLTNHPWGAMIAVVSVDVDRLLVSVRNIFVVEECGRILNEESVVEQLRGGIVMGLGDALFEEHVYDSAGVPLTSSLLDYLLPGADSVPQMSITVRHPVAVSETAVPGKGVGEAGTIGAFAAVGSAIADAVRRAGGAGVNKLPAGPDTLYAALHAETEIPRGQR
jgi:carbon-monoxide dehydrogenase large subunit